MLHRSLAYPRHNERVPTTPTPSKKTKAKESGKKTSPKKTKTAAKDVGTTNGDDAAVQVSPEVASSRRMYAFLVKNAMSETSTILSTLLADLDVDINNMTNEQRKTLMDNTRTKIQEHKDSTKELTNMLNDMNEASK